MECLDSRLWYWNFFSQIEQLHFSSSFVLTFFLSCWKLFALLSSTMSFERSVLSDPSSALFNRTVSLMKIFSDTSTTIEIFGEHFPLSLDIDLLSAFFSFWYFLHFPPLFGTCIEFDSLVLNWWFCSMWFCKLNSSSNPNWQGKHSKSNTLFDQSSSSFWRPVPFPEIRPAVKFFKSVLAGNSSSWSASMWLFIDSTLANDFWQ